MNKPTLTGRFPEEIAALLPPGKERYRGMQIFRWIHERNAASFDDMTNLAKDLRAELSERFTIGTLDLVEVRSSSDGSTDKFLWECRDGARIESVIIRDIDRVTACVSSQVGCRMGCQFCRTATLGFTRNLTAAEIVDQLVQMRRHLVERNEDITNIVFMGMGEPMDNYNEVHRAIKLITMETALSLGRRKITVSTCGIPDGMVKLSGEFKKIGLAVSLNATDNRLRDKLMPINRAHPLETVLAASREYVRATSRRVTFEYILIEGITDSPEQARALAKIAKKIPSKVNLIIMNPYPGSSFGRPSDGACERFQQILINKNVTALMRKSKGTDISAACGQLAAGDTE
jgi:23S rRNA (adenine2503-C2)-methyltransferase